MSEGNLISGGVEPGDDPGVKESKKGIMSLEDRIPESLKLEASRGSEAAEAFHGFQLKRLLRWMWKNG
jgi:hypothetical protein